MDEKELSGKPEQGGRRLEERKGPGSKGKLAAIIAGALVAVLAVGYLGLCAVASAQRTLPGTYLEDMDLGGLDRAQVAQRLQSLSADRYDRLEVPIRVGGRTVTLSAKEAGAYIDADRAAQAALEAGKGNFLTGGWHYLQGLFGRKLPVECPVNLDNESYIHEVLDQVVQAVDQPMEPSGWELVDAQTGQAILRRGKTGQSVDRQALYDQILAALAAREEGVTAQVETAAPPEPDFDAMAQEIRREPVNATLDVATDEIVPHRMGLELDPAQARELFEGLAEGESCPLPLTTKEPEITTLDLRASLFRDILGEGTSKISGDANRVGNVKLAAAACDGAVLLPGEQMSYNQRTGQRTTAKGYRMASGYTSKGVEDMVGGGVCQPSSTLYLACLNANLEIVKRQNHRYTVSYMPDGMDATVSWPNLDYVFANNTPYPIKVSMTVEKNMLTARVYGTKTDDTYVKMESVRLSTTGAATVYQADPTVPQGTTKVLQPAHTGKKVEVYKNIYQGDGTLLSRTLVSTDTYQKTDKVIGYNPLDGAPDGSVAPATSVVDPMTGFLVDPNTGAPILDPVTGQPMTPTPAPVDPALDPAATPAPEGTLPAEPVPSDVVPTQPVEPGTVETSPPADQTPAPETVETPPVPEQTPEQPPVLPAEPTPVPAPEGIPSL